MSQKRSESKTFIGRGLIRYVRCFGCVPCIQDNCHLETTQTGQVVLDQIELDRVGEEGAIAVDGLEIVEMYLETWLREASLGESGSFAVKWLQR